MNSYRALAFFSGPPGPGELIVVFLVILVLFGPKRLPQIARSIGKALDQLRRASQDFKDQIMRIEESEPETTDHEEKHEEERGPV